MNEMLRVAALLVLSLGAAMAGRAAVFHVAPEGAAEAGKSSWQAPTSLETALAASVAGDEIWMRAGDYEFASNAVAGAVIHAAVSIRAGFVGTEKTLADRTKPGLSRLVSRSAMITNLVTFAAGSGRTFVEYLAASNSVGRGFFLNGSGDVALEHCRAEGNGRSAYVTGRGASFSGNGSNTVTLVDCTFSGNLDKHPRGSGNFEMRGLGLYAANLKSIVIRDSVFERNGVWAGLPSQRAQVASGTATDCERQSVLCFENAPVTATNVKFIGNCVTGKRMNGGRVVYLCGASGGSSFTDCEWSANDMLMGVGDCYARYQGAMNKPRFKLSCGQYAGAVTVDLARRSDTVAFSGCKFAYNVTGFGWTAGLNVAKGRVSTKNCVFWGNVINARWGQFADLFVGFEGKAAIDSTLFGGRGGRHFDDNDALVTLGAGMIYGDPRFGTTKADFIADYLAFHGKFVTLDETTFPFADSTDAVFEDTSAGGGNQAQLWIANGIWQEVKKQVPDKVAPLASLDTTVSKTDGAFKAKPAAALEVAAVDVTTPLDLKPEFKVTTGAGDTASVTCHYSTRKPSDAGSPTCYTQSVSCGNFGDRQSFRITGAKGCESGATVYWLVRAENAAGVSTKSGTCVTAGAAPTEWSAKDISIAPAQVPTSQVCGGLDWKVHYRFLGNRYFGTQQQGGRPVYWYRHLDDPSWGRAYDPELGKDQELTPDWFALMKPADGDVDGRPLLVTLHGRGGGAKGFVGVDFSGTNSVYSTPGDFYAIALDCRENALNDFWWGAMPPATKEAGMTVGFILAPYNESYYSFIGGATMYGELNMGPSGEKFKYHRTSCLDWCRRGEPPCMKRVLDTVEWAVRKFKIDRNRIYLCGNSMGGQGALAIGLRHGEVFAAVNGNVPATIWYPAAQMGFIDVNGQDVDAASFTAPKYDPPICLDWSGSNDAWSRDHDVVFRNMNRFRFQYLGWWGDFGHCGQYAAAREKNDTLCRTIDWLKVRKDEAYPVFANADSNSALPWPQQGWLAADGSGGKVVGGVETAKGTITPRDGGDLVGQWNGWFRWEVVEDSADALKMKLWIANEEELPSATFKRPTSARVDVSPRRLQNFRIDGKTVGTWTFDGGQSGRIVYDEKLKVATAPALKLTQTPRLLTFKKG